MKIEDRLAIAIASTKAMTEECEGLTAKIEELQYANDFCGKTIERLTTALDMIAGERDILLTEDEVSRLTTEKEIKDRALVVARGVLEELCAFIWEEHEDNMMREHILRARDQVMNARLGKLSSDPFPQD